MRVFISAGEASGDAYGAFFIRELRRLGAAYTFEFQALGGRLLAEENAQIIVDSSTFGAVGIAQAIKEAPRVAVEFQKVKRALRSGKPGLFVPIDFGFVNIRLCRIARAAGWKVLYFIPPGSWRRNRQGRDLPSVTDAISTPFEWSAKILNQRGARAYWFGHPIKQLIDSSGGEGTRRETIAILPGSRRHEIHLNLPLMAQALRDRTETFEFVVAPSVNMGNLQERWATLSGRAGDHFSSSEKYRILREAKAGVVCSGTATLEAALCGCPMVVLYKTTALMHFQGFLMRLRNVRISLPNLFLERDLLPELRGWNIRPSEVRSALEHVLRDSTTQQRGFRDLEALLGGDHAITDTAKVALDLIERYLR